MFSQSPSLTPFNTFGLDVRAEQIVVVAFSRPDDRTGSGVPAGAATRGG
ncbi:hypothetical protein LU631_01525 [Erwinia tracheiphila]|nr:hypothetical protein [Erwinia tracheiphila]UIA87825.1 hypothetical protein LU631_24865 [Erwinia tracheiphila]UIA88170.1 hypothetical protein LU631_01525 [Erwinia tracheiphila]UIA96410.1 hypothetical protein LU633_24635 [Erwinia tracheiphila]UIA96763.1 hypothetical protein LU633_01525 [Erwinia tracheiphila]